MAPRTHADLCWLKDEIDIQMKLRLLYLKTLINRVSISRDILLSPSGYRIWPPDGAAWIPFWSLPTATPGGQGGQQRPKMINWQRNNRSYSAWRHTEDLKKSLLKILDGYSYTLLEPQNCNFRFISMIPFSTSCQFVARTWMRSKFSALLNTFQRLQTRK